MLLAVVCAALLTVCGASPPIIFGTPRRFSECVLSDGRQGRCTYPTSCAALTGPVLPDCVKPCEMTAFHELMICCPLDELTTTTTTTTTITTTPTTTTTTAPAPPAECGHVRVAGQLMRHIAFGAPSLQGHWPWMALYGWRNASGHLSWQCGGALISARHVLTAAHCVERRGALDVVRVGEHDLTKTSDARHQDVAVLRVAVPPNRRGHHDDIAVLTLAEPVRFNDHVGVVCLPSAVSGDPSVGRDVTVAGWGRLEYSGRTSDQLQEAVQQVMATDKCEEIYSDLRIYKEQYPGGFGVSKLCAMDTFGGHMDACRGDSGGPLVVHGPDHRYSVVGVVSSGIGCGHPVFPSIYTRVTSYLDWIEEQIA